MFALLVYALRSLRRGQLASRMQKDCVHFFSLLPRPKKKCFLVGIMQNEINLSAFRATFDFFSEWQSKKDRRQTTPACGSRLLLIRNERADRAKKIEDR